MAMQAQALTREVTADELQAQLQQHFPLQRELPFTSITFSEPQIVLREGSDRIGIRVSLAMVALGDLAGKARGLLEGQLRYAPQTGEFFLDQPSVREFKATGMAREYQEEMRMLVETLAQQALAELPIYQLAEDDPQQAMARLFLQSVTVTDGKLILELDL